MNMSKRGMNMNAVAPYRFNGLTLASRRAVQLCMLLALIGGMAGQVWAANAIWTNATAATYLWTNMAPNTTGWNPNSTYPDGIGQIASNNTINANNINLSLQKTITLGALLLGDTSGANSYVIQAGVGGSLVFDTSSGSALIAHITPGTASDIISANIQLNKDLLVTNATVGGITISGSITESGIRSVTFRGDAAANTNILSGINNYTGGTTNLNGLLVITNANTTIGPLVVLGGTVQLRHGSALGNSALNRKNVTINGGVLEASSAYTSFTQTLGTGDDTIQITGGASGFSAVTTATVNLNGGGLVTWGAGTYFDPAIFVLNGTNGSAALTFQNALDLNSASARTIRVDGTGLVTMSGIISNNLAGGLTKAGTGVLALSNTGNTIGGPLTVSAGAIRGTDDTMIPNTQNVTLSGGQWESAANINRTFGSGAGDTIQLTGNNAGFSAVGGAITVNLGAIWDWGSTYFNPGTSLVLNGPNANNALTNANGIKFSTSGVTISNQANRVVISGALDGSGNWTKSGSGTLVLTSGSQLNSGLITVSGGFLEIASDANLSANPVGFTANQLTLAGGTLTVTDNINWNSNRGITLGTGGGTISNAPTKTLTLAQPIAGGTGAIGLTIVGSGTLLLGGAALLADGGAITVNGGTLDVGTQNETVGNVTLTGGGTITGSSGSLNPTNIAATGSGTISALISSASALVKSTANTTTTVTRTDNVFTNATAVQSGVLDIMSLADVGTACSLGQPTTVANGTISLGAAATVGTLRYAGTTDSTSNRKISMAGTTGGATIEITSTGGLRLTTGFATMANNAKTLTLGGNGTGIGIIEGVITNHTVNAVSLSKTGSGTWALYGQNTYTGATTIAGGKLSITNISNGATASPIGASSATSAGLVLSGGTLEFAGVGASYSSDRSFILTAATTNTISVTNADTTLKITGTNTATATSVLRKAGAGKLILSGRLVNAGHTQVDAGVLEFDGTATNAININSLATLAGTGTVAAVTNNAGGIIAPGLPGTAGGSPLTPSNLVLAAGGKLAFEFNGTTVDTIVVAANNGLTINGGDIYLYEQGTTTPWAAQDGTYNLIQYSGTLGGAGAGSLQVAPSCKVVGKQYSIGVSGGWVQLSIAPKSEAYWSGTGGDTNWTTSGNWNGGAGPAPSAGDALYFQLGNLANYNDYANGTTFASIGFLGPLPFTLLGNSVTLTNEVVNLDASTNTVALSLILSNRVTVNAASGPLVLSGDISSDASSGITKLGDYTVTLSGNNTYQGATTNSGGILQIGDGGSSGSLGAGDVHNNGSIVVNRSGEVLVSGVITGPGSITNAGSGTIRLAGNSTYTGPTVINDGAVQVENSGGLGGTGGGTVVADGGALLLTNGITVADFLTLAGTGDAESGSLVNLGQNNAYSGVIISSGSGEIRINSAADQLTLSGGITNNTGLALGGAGNIVIQTAGIVGSGAVIKDGAGIVTLSATNKYLGTTTVTNGTLRLGAANYVPNTTLTVDGPNAVFDMVNYAEAVNGIVLNNGGTIVGGTGILTNQVNIFDFRSGSVSAPLGGSVALFKTTAGTVTLSNTTASTFSGLTTISEGVLNIRNNSALGSTAATIVSNGAVLQVQGALSGVTEPLNLIGSGPGGLGALRNMADTNTYSGIITNGGGAVIGVAANSMLKIGSVVTPNDTLTLLVEDNAILTNTVAISGANGNVIKDGPGRWVAAIANTYGGTLTIKDGTAQSAIAGAIPVANVVTVGDIADNTTTGKLSIGGAAAAVIQVVSGLKTEGAGGSVVGAYNLSSTLTVSNNASDYTFAGRIGGDNQYENNLMLVKHGSGIFTIGGANSYTGTTTISGGTLQAGATDVIPDVSAITISPAAGFATAALDLNGFNETVNSLNLGGVAGSTPSVATGAGTLTVTNSITYTATGNPNGGTIDGHLNFNNGVRAITVGNSTGADPDLTISADITSGGLSASGAGTLLLSGASDFAGAITNAMTGALIFSSPNNLGAASTDPYNLVLNASSVLRYTGSGATLSRAFRVAGATTIDVVGSGVALTMGDASIGGALYATNSGTGQSTLNIGNAQLTAATITFMANMADLNIGNVTNYVGGNMDVILNGTNTTSSIGRIDGTRFLTKAGLGTWTLNGGGEVFTGPLTISAGTLQAGASEVIPNATAVTINNGTLDLQNNTETIGGLLTLGNLASGSQVITMGASGVLIMNNNLMYNATGNPVTAPQIQGGTVDLGAATRTFTVSNNTSVASDLLISANMSNGTLAKAAPGTLELSGNNASSLAITIAAGQVLLSGTQAGSSTVNSGGTLVVNGTHSGATTVNSGGSLSLTGTCGTVTLNAGAVLSGTGTCGAVTANAGSTISVGGPGASPNEKLTVSTLTLNDGSTNVFEVGFEPTGMTNDTIEVTTSGGLSLGFAWICLYTNGMTTTVNSNGIYKLFKYSGDIAGSGVSALSVLNPDPAKSYNFGLSGGYVTLTIGDTAQWDGEGTDQNWTTDQNWNNDTPVSAYNQLVFGGQLNLFPTNNLAAVDPVFLGITFDTTAGGFTLDGSRIALEGNILNSCTNAQTIDMDLVIDSMRRQVNPASNNITINGVISGSGGLIKWGTGKLTLTGNNTFSGGVSIYNGILSVSSLANGGSACALGASSSSADNLLMAGGTLEYTGGDVSMNRNFTLLNGTTSAFDVPLGTVLTLTGVADATAGSVTFKGGGSYTLSGNNLNTGTNTVQAGTVTYGVDNALSPNSDLVITNSGTLDLNGHNATVKTVLMAPHTVGTITGGRIQANKVTVDGGSTTDYYGYNTIGAVIEGGLGEGIESFHAEYSTVFLTASNTFVGQFYQNNGWIYCSSIASGGVACALGASSAASNNWYFDNSCFAYTGPSAASDRSWIQRRAARFSVTETNTVLTLNGNAYDDGSNTPMLEKYGAGTLVMAGTYQNKYKGVGYNTFEIYDGTVRLNGVYRWLGGSAVSNPAVTINGYDSLNLWGPGTLAGTGTVYGIVTNANGILSPGLPDIAGGTLNVNGLCARPGSNSIVIHFNDTTNDSVNVMEENGVDFKSTATNWFVLYKEGTEQTWTNTGTYNLIRYTNSAIRDPSYMEAALVVSNTVQGKFYAFGKDGTWISLTVGDLRTWDGGGSDAKWSTSTNWVDDLALPAGAFLVFAGSTQTSPSNDTPANTAYAAINFETNAAAFTLVGNAITLKGNVTNSSANLQTIGLAMILDAGMHAFNATGAAMVVNGDISEVNGPSGLVKSGTNTLTLNGASTYNGATSVTNGTLIVNGSLDVDSAVTVYSNATLSGTGTVAGVVTNMGYGTLAPGLNGTAGGRLTIGSLALNDKSVTVFEFSDTTNDQVNVTASDGLTISGGSIYINAYDEGPGGVWTNAGTNTLIVYSGTLNGSEADLVVQNPAPGKLYTFTNDAANHRIDLIIDNAPTPVVDNDNGAKNVTTTAADLLGNLSYTHDEDAFVTVFYGTSNGGNTVSAWAHTNDMGWLTGVQGLTNRPTDLVQDTTYYYTYFASNLNGFTWASNQEVFITSEVWIEKTADVFEAGPGTGTFTVHRASTATNEALTLSYAVDPSSTADAGTNYVALSGTVTMNAGQSNGFIVVTPIFEKLDFADKTLTLNLTGGKCAFGTTSATMTISNSPLPTRTWWNYKKDGKWSTPTNWIPYGIPESYDQILFTNTCNDNCTAADSVPSILGSITLDGYTGTVTLNDSAVSGNPMTLAVLYDVIVRSGNLKLMGDQLYAPYGRGYTLIATNITVAGGAALQSDYAGFSSGPGRATTYNTGAGHGGQPGGTITAGYPYALDVRGSMYGSATNPISLGSGDEDYPGGGAIKLLPHGTVTVNGRLSADAWSANNAPGSGGSIWIQGGTLTGTGTISALGGAYATHGHGGGGRIDLSGTTNNFTGMISVKSRSSTTTLNEQRGQAGSLLLPWSEGTGCTMGNFTPYGTNFAFGNSVSFGTVIVTNGVVLTLDANEGQNEFTFGSLTIQSGGVVRCMGNPQVPNTAVGGSYSDLKGLGVNLYVTNLTVEAGGSLNADGTGYNTNYFWKNLGNGAYGGFTANGGGTPYGTVTNQTELGSGRTGAGGGAIKLVVYSAIVNDGTISANGTGSGASTAGGAGGSLWIDCDSISGAGTIAANGSTTNGTSAGSGASGGRIHLLYNSKGGVNPVDSGKVTAHGGGTTAASKGAAGSIYLVDRGTGTTSFRVVNNGQSTNIAYTALTPGAVTWTFDSVWVAPYGVFELPTNATLYVGSVFSNADTFIGQYNSSVILTGASEVLVSGDNYFQNFTISNDTLKTVRFAAGKTNTVNKALGLYNAKIVSQTPGQWWYLALSTNTGSQSVTNNVQVQDSNAEPGRAIDPKLSSGSTNLGHNVNWKFPVQPGSRYLIY